MSDTTQEPIEAAKIESEEMHKKAVRETMKLFSKYIVYEKDKPDEARIMEFPANMHITEDQIELEINSRYANVPQARLSGSEEDQRSIREAVDDGIKVLKSRTDDAFTPPGEGTLSQAEFEALHDVAYEQARLFYRVSQEDAMRGEIAICSKYTMRGNLRAGSSFRHWITVDAMASLFVDILSDDGIRDKLGAMIKYDEENDKGHARWFMRWREAESL